MLMHLKTMFDCYYLINSMIFILKFLKSMALYFAMVLQSTGGWIFSLILLFQGQAIYILSAINVSTVVKGIGL